MMFVRSRYSILTIMLIVREHYDFNTPFMYDYSPTKPENNKHKLSSQKCSQQKEVDTFYVS